MYHRLASLYDTPVRLALAGKMLEKTRHILAVQGIEKPGPIYDAGCGSGTVAIGLALTGWQVFGVDVSPEMLAMGTQKADEANVSVCFEQGDITQWQPKTPVAVILAYCDVLNHLNTDELHQTLGVFYQNLQPGGRLLFDINTLDAYQSELWNFNTSTLTGVNCQAYIKSAYESSQQRVTMDMNVAQYNDEGSLVWHEDTLYQYYHSEGNMEKLLQAQGFSSIQYEDYTPIDINAFEPGLKQAIDLKTFWHCQK